MTSEKNDLDYFNKGIAENSKFWDRIGGMPDFSGKSVLDVGCGHGSLCVDMARAGAAKVVGVDINQALIDFANQNLAENCVDLAHRVSFKKIDLKDFEDIEQFDYVTSKDSFEHILNLSSMLQEMKKRVRCGGRIFIGFGPLYNSYYGDHRRTKLLIPWAHVFLPEAIIIWYLNFFHKIKIRDITDLGLNKLSLKEYSQLFNDSGMDIVSMGINVNKHPVSTVFTLFSRIGLLKEYCSHNIYCVLEKRKY